MAKKKSAAKKSAKSAVKSKAHVKHHAKAADKEPEYMIQISDPKMMRKDILESLREIILFMQGYEHFMQVKEEKVALITQLKLQVKELKSLIDYKFPRVLPKGKLKSLVLKESKPAVPAKEEEEEMPEEEEEKMMAHPKMAPKKEVPAPAESPNELEDLERQLRDIEGQLRAIR